MRSRCVCARVRGLRVCVQLLRAGVEIQYVPEAGHSMFRDNPEYFQKLLLSLIQKWCEGGGGGRGGEEGGGGGQGGDLLGGTECPQKP